MSDTLVYKLNFVLFMELFVMNEQSKLAGLRIGACSHNP